MILCIESWKGDIYLYGKQISVYELKGQMHSIEKIYDEDLDNFVPLLCRMYHWECLNEADDQLPDYTYDRDTQLVLTHN